MPTNEQIQQAEDRIDQLFSGFRMAKIQRPKYQHNLSTTVTQLEDVKTEIDAIIAVLESE